MDFSMIFSLIWKIVLAVLKKEGVCSIPSSDVFQPCEVSQTTYFLVCRMGIRKLYRVLVRMVGDPV